MAAPVSNKQSSSKVVLTAEEQNEIRRNKKRKQKTSGGRAPHQTGGFQTGLLTDRVNQRGVDLLDFLDDRMVSATPSVNESLREAMLAYVTSFTDQTQGAWHLRHIAAKTLALEPLTGTLRRYAEAQLDKAFSATRPVR